MDDETQLLKPGRLPFHGPDCAACSGADKHLLPPEYALWVLDLCPWGRHFLRVCLVLCAARQVYGGYDAQRHRHYSLALYHGAEPVPLHSDAPEYPTGRQSQELAGLAL